MLRTWESTSWSSTPPSSASETIVSAVGNEQREGGAHVGVMKALAALVQPALAHYDVVGVGRFRFELAGQDFYLTVQALIFPAHEIDLKCA